MIFLVSATINFLSPEMFGRESQLPQNLLSEHFSLSGQVENKNNNNNKNNLGDLNLHDIVGITNKF